MPFHDKSEERPTSGAQPSAAHHPLAERRGAPTPCESERRHAPSVSERARIRDAWTAFWQDPSSGRGCVRGAPEVTAALGAHWRGFAAALEEGARVLDLGCGAGAAGQALVAARGDIAVTGVDFARVPPSADARIRLLSNAPMENLSFDGAGFHAAISQFGFEYSRTHKAAPRLARALAPGARLSFIVHHAQSSIVAANRASLAAIRAIQEAELRAPFLAGGGFTLSAKLSALSRAHPGERLVAELSSGLPVRARAGGAKAAAWDAVEEILAQERTILEALDACCVAPEEMEGWLGPLRPSFAIRSVSSLRKENGDPIAWRIDASRL